ncbi:hypothetical protein [Aliarcobacter butzleri]|uniref:hypothetical protein n=1 Tax=Aliarcobacter butzleri TaxID=28197 RepID=UPI001260429C|nr:hypothetical protein [Aliarcobacter butzleri]
MKKYFKILITLFLTVSLATANGGVIEECVNIGNESFMPVSDERGNVILTKKEFNRDCVLKKEVQGACLKWEQINETFIIEADNYDAYRSRNHEGSIGSILAIMGAYDQLEHLWSGWKGYCEKGTKTNFDWANDPMFWAGMAMSAAMSQMGNGGNTAMENAYKNAYKEGMGVIEGNIAGMLAGLGAATLENSASCLLAGGFNMATDLLQYANATNAANSDDQCNPVDEFCGSTAEQTKESELMTIDKVQYNDLIASNPDFAKYIIILNEENGILTIRYTHPNEMEGAEMSNLAELQKMKEKMAQMQLVISSSITALKIGACVTGFSSPADQTIPTGINQDEDRMTVKNGVKTGISMIPAEKLGPYGVAIKMALTIVANFLFSFDKVDTCENEDDAENAGKRHLKTYESKPHNLCYFVYDECVDNCGGAFLGMAKELRGYNYCCYDQILTKVLVVQLKAQLGRDWSNCTGITLRDLNFVSFRQCSAQEMQNGLDGGKEGISKIGANKEGRPMPPEQGGYDPKTTYQYKNKCINLTEFKDYLKAQIGDNIDLSDFNSIFNDVKGQAGGL